MEKKILVLAILVFLAVAFAGCPQQNKNANADNSGSQLTLQEILAKGKNIDNIEYDLVMTQPMSITAKFYQKGVKVKVETSFMGQTAIMVFNGEKAYAYDLTTDTYVETTAEGAAGMDFKDFSEQALKDVEIKELGKETVNGMNTRVIEFMYQGSGVEEKTKTKAWISEEYGIPVKMQVETSMGNAEMELKNIKIGTVSDSVFEVPADKIKSIEEMS
jgi:outer membrane lipoprotein-sorting protein